MRYPGYDTEVARPDAANGDAAAYGSAGSVAAKGPVRGFPPAPGQPPPVYPPGQFAAWNRPPDRIGSTGEEGQGRSPSGWPAAWPDAGDGAGYGSPDYSVLAVSDPAADATSTQTWAAADDRRAATGWQPPGGRPVADQAAAGLAAAGVTRAGQAAAGGAQAGQAAAGGTRAGQAAAGDAQAGMAATDSPRNGRSTAGQRPVDPARAGHASATGQRVRRPAGPTPSRPGPGRTASRVRRRRRSRLVRALLACAVIIVVGLGGWAAYSRLVAAPHSTTPGAAPTVHPTTIPTSASTKPAAPGGRWKYIVARKTDRLPLTRGQLFPDVVKAGRTTYVRTISRLSPTCTAVVIGKRLGTAVAKAGCTQVARASYLSASKKVMGTIGVLNLSSVTAATLAGQATGPSNFIAQLAAKSGPTRRLRKGTGIEEAHVKGHYLILTWVEFANLRAPKTRAERAQLGAFSRHLILGTVNVSLTKRMVTGKP